ncbi:MAG TPA: MotA/TolQ/ExbB proton channel family protein [Pirellulales bacterium]|nr:MotA/TolQ/ExbB proton channel family protein [Pirellulales bacterium]
MNRSRFKTAQPNSARRPHGLFRGSSAVASTLAITLVLAVASTGMLSRAFGQSADSPTTVPTLDEPTVVRGPSAAAAPAPLTDSATSPAASGAGGSSTAAKGDAAGAIPTKNLFSIIREGGLAMLPLLVCSFIMVVFVFERTISLRRGRVVPGPFVTRFLQQLKEGQLDRDGAIKVCQENGSPVSRVFSAAAKKWGRPAVEVEQAVIDAGERVVHELRRYLRVFNSIATIGPMLGLLGTVGGMIRAFNNIATSDAMGRPELLAKGISEALLATATGLMVAVPAIVLYWWFVSIVDRLTVRIDALGQDVVNTISAEALQEAAKPTRTPRKTAA